MNPLANMFGQQGSAPKQNNTNNIADQFSQFASTFQGDPKQKVMELLQSGQMSKQQFNWYSAIARNFPFRR